MKPSPRQIQVLDQMARIIPPTDHANELNLAPSWLTMHDGRRATIDVFYPAVPLAFVLRKRWDDKEHKFLINRLSELGCPCIVLNRKFKITEQSLRKLLKELISLVKVEELEHYV